MPAISIQNVVYTIYYDNHHTTKSKLKIYRIKQKRSTFSLKSFSKFYSFESYTVRAFYTSNTIMVNQILDYFLGKNSKQCSRNTLFRQISDVIKYNTKKLSKTIIIQLEHKIEIYKYKIKRKIRKKKRSGTFELFYRYFDRIPSTNMI